LESKLSIGEIGDVVKTMFYLLTRSTIVDILLCVTCAPIIGGAEFR